MDTYNAVAVLSNAVERGMLFLDAKCPGWLPKLQERVELGMFSINSCTTCALSTAAEVRYSQAIEQYNLGQEDQNMLGFAAWDRAFWHSDSAQHVHDAVLFLVSEAPWWPRHDVPLDVDPEGGCWWPLTLAWEWAIMQRVAQEAKVITICPGFTVEEV